MTFCFQCESYSEALSYSKIVQFNLTNCKNKSFFQVKYSEGEIKVPYPKAGFLTKRVPKVCVNDKVAASWSSGLVCESRNGPVLGGSCCWTVHPTDITTAYGSPAPKPFFFWNTACVSEREDAGNKGVNFSPQLQNNTKSNEIMGLDYLCKFDWLSFGYVFCIFARKHSTVTAIHLLRDFLRRHKKGKCHWSKMREYSKCQC